MDKDKQYRKKLKHYNTTGHAHELTFSCYHRYDYLVDPVACDLFLAELDRARAEYEFRIWAYVLMPSHVHLLIWPLTSSYDISEVLNTIKGRMSKAYRDIVSKNSSEHFEKYTVSDKSKGRKVFRFWQNGGGFDRNLWNAKAIHNAIGYIEANPVRKKLVTSQEDYQWSSAFARKKQVGVIPDRFDMPVAMSDPQYQRISGV